MDLDDLWIGDALRIISTGQIGKYHGNKNGKALILVHEKVISADPSDWELIEEKEAKNSTGNNENEPGIDLTAIANFDPTLDLHHEALLKAGYKQPGGEVLEWQLNICRSFLNKAKSLGVSRLRIIHGIGAGILRNEIEYMINNLSFISDFESSSDGGSIIVYLLS